jgi:hypothetical protein
MLTSSTDHMSDKFHMIQGDDTALLKFEVKEPVMAGSDQPIKSIAPSLSEPRPTKRKIIFSLVRSEELLAIQVSVSTKSRG